MSSRYAFEVSLWKRAAAAAAALHGEDTLVSVFCALEQAASLCNQAGAEASPVDSAALRAESWALTSGVLPLVSTRMDNNTLLPGRCTKEEVEFFKRFTLVKLAANLAPPLPARGMQLNGFGVGYAVLLSAACRVLCQFGLGPRPPPAALAFVLRTMDIVRPARRACKLLNDSFFYRCCQLRAACER